MTGRNPSRSGTALPSRQPGAGTAGPGAGVRRWLAAAIAAAAASGCRDCRTRQPCAGHAADAVLNACRQERLFIMPAADADALLAVGRRDDSR